MQKITLSAFSDEAGKTLKDQIKALIENNICYTEIRSVDGVGVADFSLANAKEYVKELNDNGISVWSVGSPLGKEDINIDFNKYLDKVKHVFELANVLKTDKIRAFSFFKAYNEKNIVFDYMNKMAELSKQYGVTLYHENEKDVYGDVLARVLEIMDNVKGWKWVYDPANFIQVGEKAEDTISALFTKTDYFHIKDVIAETEELVPAGYGDGKIAKIISLVNDEKVFTLEPHLTIFDSYVHIDNFELKTKFKFSSPREAFDKAVSSLKELLVNAGYTEKGKSFIK